MLFSDARLLFKNTGMKAVDTSVRCTLSKEFLRKTRFPDSVSAVLWDVDRFNVSAIILSLFL